MPLLNWVGNLSLEETKNTTDIQVYNKCYTHWHCVRVTSVEVVLHCFYSFCKYFSIIFKKNEDTEKTVTY